MMRSWAVARGAAPAAGFPVIMNSFLSGAGRFFERNKKQEWVIPAVLCLAMLGQALVAVVQLSQTADESTHLYAGYRLLKCGDYGFGREHPPLAKALDATPLLAMNVTADCKILPREIEAHASLQWLYSQDWQAALLRARMAASLFSVGLCLLIWTMTRRMFGLLAAAIATTLFAFEPTVLGNAALVTTDMPAALTFALAIFCFYRWTSKPTSGNLLLAGFATSAALLAKHSSIVILPIFCLLAVADAWASPKGEEPRWHMIVRNLIAVVAIGWITVGAIWCAYGWRYSVAEGYLVAVYSPTVKILLAAKWAHLLPAAYLDGLIEAIGISAQTVGQPFLGEVHQTAPWYFFPVNMLIRYTAAMLLMMALAAPGLWMAFKRHRREFVYLLLPAAFYLGLAMRANMLSGIRHLLPMLPFVLMLVAAGWAELTERARWARYALGALLVLHAASSMFSAPNYLSYANEAWGGSGNAYKFLPWVDWGQSYKQVKTYMDRHGGGPCWVATEFRMDPRKYGSDCQAFGRPFPDELPAHISGTVFVSSAFLANYGQPGGPLEPFATRPPDDRVGGSALLVYKGEFDTRVAAARSLVSIANGEFKLGLYDDALRHGREAVSLAPANPEPHRMMCSLLLPYGEVDTALRECETARALAAKSPTYEHEAPEIEKLMEKIRVIFKKKGTATREY